MAKTNTRAPAPAEDYAPLTREDARLAVAEAERCAGELKAKVEAATAEERAARKAALAEQTMRDSAPRRPTVAVLDESGGPNPTGVAQFRGGEMMQGVDHTPQPSCAALDRWTTAVSRRQSLEALLAAAMGDLESARHDFTHAEA